MIKKIAWIFPLSLLLIVCIWTSVSGFSLTQPKYKSFGQINEERAQDLAKDVRSGSYHNRGFFSSGGK